MSEHPSVTASLPHVVGESYDFQTIRTALGGQPLPPNFVIHRDGAILGVCLGMMWNPLAESVKLAATTGPLPVYVRREEGGNWFYIGLHEVTGSSTEPSDIRHRLKPPVITSISRIIYLKRIQVVGTPMDANL